MESNKDKFYNKNYYILLTLVFTGYLVFGFSENIKGPAIPRIQVDFGLDEMQIGLLLALNSLGYLFACSFTGMLTRKFGIRFSNILAFGTMALSGVFIFLSVNYPTLSVSYFLMYIGNGILEIALGVLSAKVFTKNTGMMMNLAHFFYGLSSTIAPIVATRLMKMNALGRNFSWHEMYLVMLSLSVVPLVISLFPKFPEDDTQEEESISIKEYAKDPAAWMLVIILSFGVISEIAVGGWLVNFLEKVYKWDIKAASALLSAFFFTFTLSRLLLGPFTDKIGFTKSLIIFSGGAGFLTLMGIIIGQSAAILLALAGAGIAPIYPTVMALLSKRYSKNSSIAVSFTVTLMGIGNVIGNFLVGGIIELFKNIFTDIYGVENGLIIGMKAGYAFVGICAMLCSISSVILYNFLKKQNQIL